MTVRTLIDGRATRASLTNAMEQSPSYLRPIIESVRDYGTAMLFVPQGIEPFRVPPMPRKPVIVMVGDDFDAAQGPDGFHLRSIRRLIRASLAFAVVSSAPQDEVYESIARMAALTRRNTMLVETRPEQELAWVGLIQRLAPKRFIWLATIEGGHA